MLVDDASLGTDRLSTPVYGDLPNRSPWVAQLAPDGPAVSLGADSTVDVVVVGAGIAGIATAFFTLRSTSKSVLLVERDRVGRGASGHNAGQLTTYFERPLCDIAAEFGSGLAGAAQRGIEDAHGLLDAMATEAGVTVRVERFLGHMGMFNRHHLDVHLRSMLVRRDEGLPKQMCVVSEDAEFLPELPDAFAGLYSVVPQSEIGELLEVDDDRYRAVLSAPAGCSNSGLLCQQVLAYLRVTYPDRLAYADRTHVERIVIDDDAVVVHAGGHRVRAGHVVLCTNGFVDHQVEDAAGSPLGLHHDQRIIGRVAHMTAFAEETPRAPASLSYIRNRVIGGDVPYVYVTRRTYDRSDDVVTLTCMGGPEYPFLETYDREALFPGDLLLEMDDEVRPFAQPKRPRHVSYDFHWHGLMGYNDCGIRVVGAHPHHPELVYNLGCNGVGFLPSIHGGWRIAELLAGKQLGPSVFDPR
jgi:glycine/D-amino acid oxidase-like deaminating enzyme